MWHRLTEKARAAVWAANGAADLSGGRDVTTEHLLLGLLSDEDTVACHLLKQNGVQPERLAETLQSSLSQDTPKAGQERVLSAGAYLAISLASDEARELGCSYIGTEHLLLGIVQGDSAATHLLHGHGVDAGQLRDLLAASPTPKR